MNYLGIDYDIKNVPVLDEGFIPFGVWMREYLKGAEHPIARPTCAMSSAS